MADAAAAAAPPAAVVRLGRRDEACQLLEMIKELAAFEKEAEQVKMTEETLMRDGWPLPPDVAAGAVPRFQVLFAEVDGALVGHWDKNQGVWHLDSQDFGCTMSVYCQWAPDAGQGVDARNRIFERSRVRPGGDGPVLSQLLDVGGARDLPGGPVRQAGLPWAGHRDAVDPWGGEGGARARVRAAAVAGHRFQRVCAEVRRRHSPTRTRAPPYILGAKTPDI